MATKALMVVVVALLLSSACAVSTATPTPVWRAALPTSVSPTPPTSPPSKPNAPGQDTSLKGQQRYIAATDGLGVRLRDKCSDDSLGSGAWPEGATVRIEYRHADCAGWLRVQANGLSSWVREEYLSSQPPVKRPIPPAGVIARVVKVVDGDTIDVEIEGKVYRVRYIGMDTPETVDPRKPVECYGREASAKNGTLVSGKTVRLEKDVSETDKYDRLLRYVWLEDEMVNEILVREGYAQASTYPPDVRYQDRLMAAQREARDANRGLWGASCATPSPSSLSPETSPKPADKPTEPSGCPNGCSTPPPSCLIKGNISTSGEKIYHVPGGAFYSQTVISPSKGERWFCTEQEAMQNGWRKSLR